MSEVFSILKERPPKEGLTVSAAVFSEENVKATVFSLGKGTDIAPERYDNQTLYLVLSGDGEFFGDDKNGLMSGDALITNKNALCGVKTVNGLVYIEILTKKEFSMNNLLKSGEVFRLASLVPYEKGGITNMDVISNEAVKLAVMAFDEGCALSPHRAPGDALIFALEGEATIGYEGKEYRICAGENFRFEKNGLHSVKAEGKFKMALLLALK